MNKRLQESELLETRVPSDSSLSPSYAGDLETQCSAERQQAVASYIHWSTDHRGRAEGVGWHVGGPAEWCACSNEEWQRIIPTFKNYRDYKLHHTLTSAEMSQKPRSCYWERLEESRDTVMKRHPPPQANQHHSCSVNMLLATGWGSQKYQFWFP